MKLIRLLKSKKTGKIYCPTCLKEVKEVRLEHCTVLKCKKCQLYYPNNTFDYKKNKEVKNK